GSDGSSSTTLPPADLVIDAGPGLVWGQTAYTTTAGSAVAVAVVNRDTILHTMVIVDDTKKVLGPELEVGKRGDVDTGTFNLAPGEYQILCRVPGHGGMTATLTVTGE
ncbi:MAG TPA: hypothetical protein PLV68_17675, partial [Ilumatobacteraceae bacterium]|nr:hypothetical protein [Ilumatobacteraceae bacterium]